MDLRTERKLYREGARVLARVSGAAPTASNAEWVKERTAERNLKASAVAEAVRQMLQSVDLIDDGPTTDEPGWVLVAIVDRLTVEARRKPSKRKGADDG